MKYFVKARWYRNCHAFPQRSANLVIAEEPFVWLDRQRERLGDYWSGIVIDNCCQVGDDAEVSADPDLGYKSPPLTPEQQRRSDRPSYRVHGGVPAVPVWSYSVVQTDMKRQLLGGTHDGEWVDNGDCPYVRMIEKVERPVFKFSRYTPGDPIIHEKIKTEDYTLRSFAFPHHGLWCKTYCYVLSSLSDEEAAVILNRRDTQQDGDMTRFDPEQWAAWVLVGDPCGRIPGPLEVLALRIARAIRWAKEAEKNDTAKIDMLSGSATVSTPRPYVDNTGDDGGY